WPHRPRLIALVPSGEDRPLLALQLHCRVARGPDAVLVGCVCVVVVVAPEVVGLALDIGEAGPRSVVPLQLHVHTLEAVRDQLHFVPGLSHTRTLPTTSLRSHDHDLRLYLAILSRTAGLRDLCRVRGTKRRPDRWVGRGYAG